MSKQSSLFNFFKPITEPCLRLLNPVLMAQKESSILCVQEYNNQLERANKGLKRALKYNSKGYFKLKLKLKLKRQSKYQLNQIFEQGINKNPLAQIGVY